MRPGTGPQFRLRYTVADGAELRCPHCGTWWQVGLDHWVGGDRWDVCRACQRDRTRLYMALRALDPEWRADQAARLRRHRRYRARLRALRDGRQLVEAWDREVRAANREKRRVAA